MSVALRLYEQLTEAPDDKTRARLIAEAFEAVEERYPEIRDRVVHAENIASLSRFTSFIGKARHRRGSRPASRWRNTADGARGPARRAPRQCANVALRPLGRARHSLRSAPCLGALVGR